MATNKVQFQAGLSMSEFFERFGTDAQCEEALAAARWPRRVHLLSLRLEPALPLPARRSAVLAVLGMPPSNQRAQRDTV